MDKEILGKIIGSISTGVIVGLVWYLAGNSIYEVLVIGYFGVMLKYLFLKK